MGNLSVSKMLGHTGSLIAEDMVAKQQQLDALFRRVAANEEMIGSLDGRISDLDQAVFKKIMTLEASLDDLANQHFPDVYNRLAILESKEAVRVRDEVTTPAQAMATRAHILVEQIWDSWTSGETLDAVMKAAEGYLHDCDRKKLYERQDVRTKCDHVISIDKDELLCDLIVKRVSGELTSLEHVCKYCPDCGEKLT